MDTLTCEFFNPVNYLGNEPLEGEPFQFKNATCSTDFISLIEDNGDAHFYLDERITYGDIFIMSFILLFFLAGIFKLVWDFIFPKTIKALTKNDF